MTENPPLALWKRKILKTIQHGATRDATFPKPQFRVQALVRIRLVATPKEPMTSLSSSSRNRGSRFFCAIDGYMSRTLCTVDKASLPLFRGFSQSLLPERAIHSTSRTTNSKSSNSTSKTPRRRIRTTSSRIARQPDLKQQLTAYLQAQLQTPNSNMAFLLPGLRRGLMLSTPLILSTPLLLQQYRNRQPIRCDGPDIVSKITNDLTRGYTSEAKTPVITESGAANPRAIRQVSMGSILGVLGGLGVSVFSKPLAILIGLGVFVLQVSHEGFENCGFYVGVIGNLYATHHICNEED
jgi:hypothetical protein